MDKKYDEKEMNNDKNETLDDEKFINDMVNDISKNNNVKINYQQTLQKPNDFVKKYVYIILYI